MIDTKYYFEIAAIARTIEMKELIAALIHNKSAKSVRVKKLWKAFSQMRAGKQGFDISVAYLLDRELNETKKDEGEEI